jgi:hypothetical protein
MEYTYSIEFEHEKPDYQRKFETNQFEQAEKMFWSMVGIARETMDNYTITWVKNKNLITLLRLVKTYD